MKLLLRRSQRAAILGGKMLFQLQVRADLTSEEKAAIAKYRLGAEILYSKNEMKQSGNEYAQLGHAIVWRTLNLTISVNDLEHGKTVECKNIVEMLGAESQIKEAAQTFKAILDAASQFDGEEVIQL